MIKIIGAIFLIGGATIMGMGASAALTSREKSLKGFLEALHIMHSEIGERLTPIDELMKILAETASIPVSILFEECVREMTEKPDVPFCLIWRKEVKRAEYLKLKPSESDTIAALG